MFAPPPPTAAYRQSLVASSVMPDGSQEEDKVCPGCQLSVMNDNGGVVIAFGQSFFHVECFKCAKCHDTVTADTNLLLLSDGQPVCSNCSYSCSVCQLPILDEAIMTGDDSYHAHCFKCRHCRNRIDELMFAKTSNGIYCMGCHHQRVARSRKHAQRKEREREERERAMPSAATATAAAAAATAPGRRPSVDAQPPSSASAALSTTTIPSISTTAIPARPGTAPASPNGPSSSSSGPSSALGGHSNSLNGLASSTSTSAQHLSPPPIATTHSLSLPSAKGRSAKRNSINPGMTFDIAAAAAEFGVRPQTSTTAATTPSSTITSNASFSTAASSSPSRPSSPNDGHAQRTRSESTPKPSTSAATDRPTLSPFASLDRTPLRKDSAHGNGVDTRAYTNGARAPLSIDVEKSRSGYSHRPAASPSHGRIAASPTPAHRVDVPRGVESGTDTDTDGDGDVRGARSRKKHAQNVSGERAAPDDDDDDDGPPEVPPKSPAPRHGMNGGSPASSPALALAHSTRSGTNGTQSPSPLGRAHSPHPLPRAESPAQGRLQQSSSLSRSYSEDAYTQSGSVSSDAYMRSGSAGAETYSYSYSPTADVPTPTGATSGAAGDDSGEAFESVRHSTFIAPALPPIRISLGAGDFSDLLRLGVGTTSGSKRQSLAAVAEMADAMAAAGSRSISDPTAGSNRGSYGSGGRSPDTLTSETSGSMLATPASTHFGDDAASVITVGARTAGPEPRIVDGGELFPRGGGRNSLDYITDSVHRDDDTKVRAYDDEEARARMDSIVSLDAADVSFNPDTSVGAITNGASITITPAPASRMRVDASDLVTRRLRDALTEASRRGAAHVNLDSEFVQTILGVLEQRKAENAEMRGRIEGMKRASQQAIDGLSVAQDEYEEELQARKFAETEVTRLRILLNDQAARITAMSGEARRGELHRQLSRELSENLSILERNMSKLRAERDITLAEVEELESSKALASSQVPSESLSRSLTTRLDSLKSKYVHELKPLTERRSALEREIAELKASRDVMIEETTMLNARNEELAVLNQIYTRRSEQQQQPDFHQSPDTLKPATSGTMLPPSASTTDLGSSESSGFVNVLPPPAPIPVPQPQQQQQQVDNGTLRKRNWLTGGGRAREQHPAAAAIAQDADNRSRLAKLKHSFQQVSVLRVTRCEQCGDKLWGSQVRCTGCNLSVHHRCQGAVMTTCSPAAMRKENPMVMPPSMFGRDLIEQIRTDSHGGDRMVPVIVEKCVDAVEALAMDYEGIYRKTGGSGQNKTITSLFERQEYDSFDLTDQDRFNDICSVTSVLKTYFRSLPNPLMTYVLHDEFMNTSMIKDPAHKSAKYADLVKQLPTEHYYTLRMLMLHLHRIHERSARNLMTARNLGVVFGPTLMRSRNPGAEFSDMAGKALTVEWLTEHAPDVFPPLPSL